MRTVNIFPNQNITLTNGMNISSPIFDAQLDDEDVLICLKKRAVVYQVFGSGLEPVKVTLANIRDDLLAQAQAKHEQDLENQKAIARLKALKESSYIKLASSDLLTDFTGMYITDLDGEVVSIPQPNTLSNYSPDITSSYSNNVFTLSGTTKTSLRTVKFLIKVDDDAAGANIVKIAKIKYAMFDVDLTSKTIVLADTVVDANSAVLQGILLVVVNNIEVS